MSESFKVWICVERVDEDKNIYEDVDPGFSSVAEYDTEAEAMTLATKVQGLSKDMADLIEARKAVSTVLKKCTCEEQSCPVCSVLTGCWTLCGDE